MTRFVSPGGIEVTTPTVDGVQRYRIKDLGGIGGHAPTWLGDYFTEEALYARLAELGTDPAKLEEVPSGYHPCPVHRHRGSRGAAGCLPWAVRRGRAYVLLGKRSRAVQDPGTWSCFGGAIAEGESPAQAAERECREEMRGITARPGTKSYAGECAACGWQYTTFLAHVRPDTADGPGRALRPGGPGRRAREDRQPDRGERAPEDPRPGRGDGRRGGQHR